MGRNFLNLATADYYERNDGSRRIAEHCQEGEKNVGDIFATWSLFDESPCSTLRKSV